MEPTPVVSELIDPEALAARWAWEMSNPPPRIKIAFTESRTRPRRMPSPAAEPEIAPPADPQPVRSSPLALPGQVEPAKGTPESPAEALVPALEPAEAPAESAEILWPSVAEILQAHKASEDLSQTVGLRNPGDQRLTEDREPVAWSVSALWVVPPALPMVLLILFGGIALNWTWSQDDRAAGQAANRLLSNSDVPSTGVALEPLPRETWWGSTADHLYLHAAAQGRIEDDPARAENSQFYLNLARGASPVHPGVLDAQNRVFRAQGRAGEVGLVSQDIVALARQAGRRLKAGDRTRALDEYRKALELAARSDPSQAQPAQEDTEGQSRRYLLPNEDLYLSVLHELATEGGDRFADWSAAVPEYAPILISAYRAAHRLGRGDAEQALEKAVQIRVPPAGCSEAEHFAGQAEALALLGRWEESVERYRDAIRLSPIQDHRRTYWLNLAEIHGRQGDLTNRRAALERAWNA
ncbi:MAG TPA: hypothetical protein VFT74_03960, partial [Isosphaeraceae bacterium]|nr:hypothetical protein [Isosphaeraceae bacterium]